MKKIDVKTQQINGLTLETYGIVIADFSLSDISEKIWFFEESFLLADISKEIVLEMPFPILGNADIHFADKKFG